MFPLILTVLNRDYSAPYCNPYYIRAVRKKGGTSQLEDLGRDRDPELPKFGIVRLRVLGVGFRV